MLLTRLSGTEPWCKLERLNGEIGAMNGRLARGFVTAACCLIAAAVPGRPQDDQPSDESLRFLQERGRTIALYLDAVERGAERFRRQSGQSKPPDRTLAIVDRDGWRVLFLRDLALDAAPTGPKKGFLLMAETSFSPDARDVGDLRVMLPPHAALASVQSYARALGEAETAAAARPDAGLPLEEAVVREKDGTFTVYLTSHARDKDEPATGEGAPKSVRFGRDFLVRVAASGRQVVSIEPLHSEAANVSLAPRAAGQPTLHTHEKGDLPTPTDVAQILRNPALAPHLVLTPRSMFRIDAEGGVTWLGANPVPAAPKPGAAGGGSP